MGGLSVSIGQNEGFALINMLTRHADQLLLQVVRTLLILVLDGQAA